MAYISEHVANNVAKWQQAFNSKGDQEYKNGCAEGLKMRDTNNDGKTSIEEMKTSARKSSTTIFKNTQFESTSNAIADDAENILQQYAGDDGVFDEAEYAAAINSEEWGAYLEKFWAMKDEIKNGGTDQKLKNNDLEGTFSSINGLKGAYIDEILNESGNITDFIINKLNSGNMSEKEADGISKQRDEIFDEYAQKLVDYTFNETQAILADDSLSNEEKSSKIDAIKEKMSEVKNEALNKVKNLTKISKIKNALKNFINKMKNSTSSTK